MGQGGLSKALIIVSKAKGWDPNRIWDSKTQSYVGESIENFNQPPELFTNQAGTGRLPQEIPANQQMFPDATESPLDVSRGLDHEQAPFNTSLQALNKNRGTKDADPFAGMGGAGG
jgi:hypothetical protein